MLTRRSYRVYSESYPFLDSEYAYDMAIIFQSRANVSDGVSSIIPYFARFGTEIRTGLIHSKRESKTVISFCSKPLFMHDNLKTLDDAHLSDVIVDEQSYIPIADHFKYLGSFISRGVTNDRDVDARILKVGNAFGSIRKSLLGFQYLRDSVKGSVYRSLILPVLLDGVESCCLTERLLQKLRSFHNRCVRAMCLSTECL